ncbi:hypothetical protein TNCV_4127621 [Trichonephila clavipes]|uniref:Uncharacterized protein n=1 Tax=Trichonephila clavipes TaxID=2585209 RepID=A0A8X6SWT5_TRICX|nr:hypothetical protein TNCV_4127621 [Trichonephila clavipes]
MSENWFDCTESLRSTDLTDCCKKIKKFGEVCTGKRSVDFSYGKDTEDAPRSKSSLEADEDTIKTLVDDTFEQLKKCLAAGFELITSNCQSLKEVVSLDRKRNVGQIGESLVIRVEVMQPFEDAGKNGWTVADFSVMMIAVDLGLQQTRRTD